MKYNLLSILALVSSADALQLRRTHLEDDQVPNSDDFAKGDQGNLNTDKMAPYQVQHEDNFHQGKFNTGTTSETA